MPWVFLFQADYVFQRKIIINSRRQELELQSYPERRWFLSLACLLCFLHYSEGMETPCPVQANVPQYVLLLHKNYSETIFSSTPEAMNQR